MLCVLQQPMEQQPMEQLPHRRVRDSDFPPALLSHGNRTRHKAHLCTRGIIFLLL